jgi:PAS domain S-box-containing protein
MRARRGSTRSTPRAKRSSPNANETTRLFAVVRDVCREDDVDRALATALRLISEAHGWAVAEAWVVRADGTALELAPVSYCRDETHRPFVDVVLGFAVERGIGLPGSAWESRQPVVTRDVVEEARFARAAFVADFGLHGALTVPVPIGAEPVVILSFFDLRPREIDTALVTALAELGPDIAALVRRRRQGLDLERQLRITEQRYRTLFDRSPAGMFVATTDGTITDGNVALASIVGGAAREDVVGRRFSDFLVDPAKWDRLVARLALDGTLGDVAVRFRRPDGEVRWTLANATKVDGENGTWRVEGQILDLTERQRSEEAQREALRGVAALARATAHEILNPLNPLLGQLALLARGAVDPETRGKIDMAIRSAEAIRDIVRRMINITQLQFGRTPDDLDSMLDLRRSAPDRWST